MSKAKQAQSASLEAATMPLPTFFEALENAEHPSAHSEKLNDLGLAICSWCYDTKCVDGCSPAPEHRRRPKKRRLSNAEGMPWKDKGSGDETETDTVSPPPSPNLAAAAPAPDEAAGTWTIKSPDEVELDRSLAKVTSIGLPSKTGMKRLYHADLNQKFPDSSARLAAVRALQIQSMIYGYQIVEQLKQMYIMAGNVKNGDIIRSKLLNRCSRLYSRRAADDTESLFGADEVDIYKKLHKYID
jgi:hypothetical protein